MDSGRLAYLTGLFSLGWVEEISFPLRWGVVHYLHFTFYIIPCFFLMKNSKGKLWVCASRIVLCEVDAVLIELLPEMDSDGLKI